MNGHVFREMAQVHNNLMEKNSVVTKRGPELIEEPEEPSEENDITNVKKMYCQDLSKHTYSGRRQGKRHDTKMRPLKAVVLNLFLQFPPI